MATHCIRLIILALLLWPSMAMAHGVKLFASVAGQSIQGLGYFVGGDFVVGAQVLLQDGNGQELARAVTDQQGKFTLSIPDNSGGPYSLKLLAGPGHSALLNLADRRRQPPLLSSAQPPNASALGLQLEQKLEQHLQPIRQQLLELQTAHSGLSFDKIVAGLGYIAGLLGLAAYIHYRRKISKLDATNK